MSHASIAIMESGGRRQYLYPALDGVYGVDAENGKILWTYPWKVTFATIPTPLVIDNERIFLTGGYGAGSEMIRLKSGADGTFEAESVYKLDEKVFGCEQQTPILYQDHIYGVSKNGELACLNLDGEVQWNSGTTRFGLGPYLIVNDVILALEDEDCVLRMAKASPRGYEELAAAKMIEGHEAWAPMALADNRLILRDITQMICVDLR